MLAICMTKKLTQILVVCRGRDWLRLESARGLERHARCLLRVSSGWREVAVVHEAGLSCGSALRCSIARMWLLLLLEASLSLRELLSLSRSHRSSARSKLRRLLHSQLLLMLLHQLELMCQLLEHVLLLRREVLRLLEDVEHLQLLLGEIERRTLLLLRLHRLLAGLESLCRYCIVVALDGVGRWSSWISLLKRHKRRRKLEKSSEHVSREKTGKVEIFVKFKLILGFFSILM